MCEYFYLKNAQGDIVGITDVCGSIKAKYTYDPWGRVIAVEKNLNPNERDIFEMNPLLYRGYVYDSETKLYYLQSRYYDPETGRFLNADDVHYIGTTQTELSYNPFAYCENDPVNNSDQSGYWGSDVHDGYNYGKMYTLKHNKKKYYYGTFYWAVYCGISNYDAYCIAQKNLEVDKIYNPVKYFYSKDKQSRHFNTNKGTGKEDTRLIWYDYYLDFSINYFNSSTNAYKRGDNVNGEKDKRQALKYLGYALHCMQDYYAHLDKYCHYTGVFWWHKPYYVDDAAKRSDTIINAVAPATCMVFLTFVAKYKYVFNKSIGNIYSVGITI